MSDFKVGDIVEVSDGGSRFNFSGRGVVQEVIGCGWFRVSAVEVRGGPWHFRQERLTLVAPDVAEPQPVPSAGAMLGFESGATRNRKEDELQFEGFLSPLALKMFAEYMHKHRHTADGGVRASDNWQKGIPDESYRDSLLRHIMDIWLVYRGWTPAARDGGDLHEALAGAFFNLQGLMHNLALRDFENEEVSQ